jgi:hypothetical protein
LTDPGQRLAELRNWLEKQVLGNRIHAPFTTR